MKARVQAALDELRPFIQADRGDVELVSVQEGVVTVRLSGMCVGCPSSSITLKAGIERHLKARVPEVTEVRQASLAAGGAAVGPEPLSTSTLPQQAAEAARAGPASVSPPAVQSLPEAGITARLRETHRRAERLLERMEAAFEALEQGERGPEQVAILEELSHFLRHELSSHMRQEDEVLFPALIPYISWGSPMNAMANQHDILHDEIAAFDPAVRAFKKGADPDMLIRLGRSIAQRLQDDFYQEEHVLFVEADQSLTGARAGALKEAMQRIAAATRREERSEPPA